MTDAQLVAVRTYSSLFEAEVAKSALDAAGIESLIRSDDSGGMRPHMWATRGVELLIREEDVQQANEILSAGGGNRRG